MKIGKETLQNITHLSRLEYEEGDDKKLLSSMNDIISWVGKLEEVDTKNVEPLTHITDENNVMREDKVIETLTTEKALHNTSNKKEDYITVPKVL